MERNKMNNFNPDRQIAIIWDIDDVQSLRPDLDDNEAMQVLSAVDDKHDANIGINWDVIQFWADELYPQDEETEEENYD
jgi:hypothetical protein